jgi:hypothetical protein
MDVGQTRRSFRPQAISRSTQDARVTPDYHLPEKQTQVRFDLHRSQEDLRSTFDQDRRQGQN